MTYRIIPPREALVDPRTGDVTRSWYRFFEHLSDSVGPGASGGGGGIGSATGGGGGPTTLEDIISQATDIQAGGPPELPNELAELRTLALLPTQAASVVATVTNVQAQLDDLRRAVYEALFPSAATIAVGMVAAEGCCMPLVTGELPGPVLIEDGFGQCIAVPIGP